DRPGSAGICLGARLIGGASAGISGASSSSLGLEGRMRVSWMACVFLVGCGSTPSVDAGPSDASSGEPDAGSIQDAGPDGGLEEEDAGSDAGPPPILCETPAEGPRTPVTDRPFHVFRADVAADCEGNLAYAWAESRAELVDDERDADIWLRVLP